MKEDSASKVTITLGRGRQVVKKADPLLDGTYGDSEWTTGRKRSVKDRLGGNIDLPMNKRLRGDGRALSLCASNVIDDPSLKEGDLRFKIMQKSVHNKTQSINQQSGLDLRDMLSRPAQSTTSTVGARQHISERKDAKEHLLESRDCRQYMSGLSDPRHRAEVRDSRQQSAEARDGRQYMSQLRDPRLHMTEVRNSRHQIAEDRDRRQHMAESQDRRQHVAEVRHSGGLIAEVRDSREHMAEVRHSRQRIPEVKDVRHHIPEPYSLSITGQTPSAPVAGSLSGMETSKTSYSPWTFECLRRKSPDGVLSSRLDRLRRRSPDGVVSSSLEHLRRGSPDGVVNSNLQHLRRRSPDGVMSSRGFSPLRREEFQRTPSVRSYDDMRVGSYMGKDVIEYSHPVASRPYMRTTLLPAGPSKLMAPPLAPPIPPGSLLQKTPHTVDVQHTVDSFLYSLGLEKFAINFKAEEVDMYALKQMGDSDLKDLGIPMGPRKKILLALQSRAKRPI